MRKLLPALGVAALLTLGLATPAHADDVSFTYTVTDQDPLSASWPSIESECLTWANGPRHYAEVLFTVSASGDYVFQDDRNPGDGRIAFLTGTYDPADVTNCFDEVDDVGTVSLSAGVEYTMMQAGIDGTLGDFQYTVTGPGAFALGPFVITTSTTSLAATPNPVTIGAPTTLTATVVGWAPTGAVEFFSGGTSLGTAPVADGVASLSVSTLPVGVSSITAVYSGDVNNSDSSSAPVSVTVTAAAAALPNMGVDIAGPAIGGFLLLIVGTTTLWGVRRRNA